MTRAEAEQKRAELQAEMDAIVIDEDLDNPSPDDPSPDDPSPDDPSPDDPSPDDPSPDEPLIDTIVQLNAKIDTLTEMLTTYIKASHTFREATIDEAYEKANDIQESAEDKLKAMITL